MKTDIILAGVGGQGILSIATVIGLAAVNSKLNIKQAEVHGMSQRGGAVYSNLRLSDAPIASDLIPLGKADIILSVEPMEALRYLPYLSNDGWVVTNIHPFVNIDNYPDIESIKDSLDIIPHHVLLDADAIASECGNTRASNMVMLGAAIPFIKMNLEDMKTAVSQMFSRKGQDVVDMNIRALCAGYEISVKEQKG